jgi:hypothetical protein
MLRPARQNMLIQRPFVPASQPSMVNLFPAFPIIESFAWRQSHHGTPHVKFSHLFS